MNQDLSWPIPARDRGGQLRVLAAGILVLGALAYLVWASMPQGTVYYQTVKELRSRAADPQPVRVAGVVAEGSIRRGPAQSRLEFDVLDGTERLPVAYTGVVPDIFGPNIEVVVEGQRDVGGTFQARTLLAKCPSRFEGAVPTPGMPDTPGGAP